MEMKIRFLRKNQVTIELISKWVPARIFRKMRG
jgi:hypothetical protein